MRNPIVWVAILLATPTVGDRPDPPAEVLSLVDLSAAAGKEDELLARLEEDREKWPWPEGLVEFRLYQDTEKEDSILLMGLWESETLYTAWVTSATYEKLRRKDPRELVRKPPRERLFRLIRADRKPGRPAPSGGGSNGRGGAPGQQE